MTTRGLKEADFTQIVDFIDESIQLTSEIASKVPGKKMKDFNESLGKEASSIPEIKAIKDKVIQFSTKFPAIGFNVETMKYK